jgi:hypothetical protein
LQLAGEENFDASVEKIARGGIARAEGLGFKTGAPSVKAGGKYAGVVEDHKIGGLKKAGKIAKLTIAEGTGGSRKVKQPGGGTVRGGLLGDEFFGKVVVEIGDEHGLIIGRGRSSAYGRM